MTVRFARTLAPAISIALIALACTASEAARSEAARSEAARQDQKPDAGRADSGRVQGRADAPIWIVEISDFQCPFCRDWHEATYAQLKREYIDAGKARFAYINLPLPSHPHAWPAAERAMCAAAQGKFWEMHDALFGSQPKWAPLPDATAFFDSLAGKAGVDVPKMRACVTSKALHPLIQADYDRAMEAGVNSTPTFIVGGVSLTGAHPIENFRKVIDSLLVARAAAPAAKP